MCAACGGFQDCWDNPWQGPGIVPATGGFIPYASCPDLVNCISGCSGNPNFEACVAFCETGKAPKVIQAKNKLFSCWDASCEEDGCPVGKCASEIGTCYGQGAGSCDQLHACLYTCSEGDDACPTFCLLSSTKQAFVQLDTLQLCMLETCDAFPWIPFEECFLNAPLLCLEEANSCGYGVGEKTPTCGGVFDCLDECADHWNPYCILNCYHGSHPEDLEAAGNLQSCLWATCPEGDDACQFNAVTPGGECGDAAMECGF